MFLGFVTWAQTNPLSYGTPTQLFFFNFKNDDFFRKIRRIANERAEAEIDRIKEEESTKRKILMKKHAV